MRIGHGFDVHAFGGSGPIIVGGVEIPFHKGLLAYSDGDVAIHALIDSLLGAAGFGDIGTLFSNNNKKYENIDSRKLLRITWNKIKNKKYKLGNIDLSIIAQAPKMLPYITQMKIYISEDLDCDIDIINIKATTTEKLGFIGREEGISCEAVALLI